MLFPKRREQYLSLLDQFIYVSGTARVTPFGSDPVTYRKIISASRTADMLGLGYKTRERCLKEIVDPSLKLGAQVDTFAETAMAHGHKYETPGCGVFLDRMKYKFVPIGSIDRQLTYCISLKNESENHRAFTIGATPDQLIYEPIDDQLALLEIKCPYRKWLDQERIDNFETACNLLSDKHYIQCQMQLLILNLKSVYLFFYVPHRDGSTSMNVCSWLIRPDPAYQQFLLSNIYQVNLELWAGSTDRFKLLNGEGKHNREKTHESKSDHCTYLIS